MNSEFLLIKFLVIISALIMVGVVIFAFNLLPIGRLIKKIITIILVVLSAFWIVASYLPSNFVRDWIEYLSKIIERILV
jgi:hypothetical protein